VLNLNAHGIKNAAALLGGWQGWKDAGLPVVTAKGTAAKK
jgi:3-mercaptopyruvate sulfurtransferase SseA